MELRVCRSIDISLSPYRLMKDDVDAASQRFPNETYVYAILVSN